jgi:hypothetical protein
MLDHSIRGSPPLPYHLHFMVGLVGGLVAKVSVKCWRVGCVGHHQDINVKHSDLIKVNLLFKSG